MKAKKRLNNKTILDYGFIKFDFVTLPIHRIYNKKKMEIVNTVHNHLFCILNNEKIKKVLQKEFKKLNLPPIIGIEIEAVTFPKCPIKILGINLKRTEGVNNICINATYSYHYLKIEKRQIVGYILLLNNFLHETIHFSIKNHQKVYEEADRITLKLLRDIFEQFSEISPNKNDFEKIKNIFKTILDQKRKDGLNLMHT